MTDRALVIDPVSGAILRKVVAPPEMLALNARDGEALFVITGDDGMHIDDGHIVVSEEGALVLAETAPAGVTAPAYDLQYVAR
ncbi:hypothetical protein [Brevundimonas viscosa]|uniref:Uncharacterized protein n=1 Tax=Brevundimonas viscosa TaxID=871741 RepID=A0A1I6PPN1_9CAUL|nr:hypothetical protein [Brevundimonas viscosa]SFS42146.1 hypothetical protein SAMN05192570_1159 [Brevundimonas viscosa]